MGRCRQIVYGERGASARGLRGEKSGFTTKHVTLICVLKPGSLGGPTQTNTNGLQLAHVSKFEMFQNGSF